MKISLEWIDELINIEMMDLDHITSKLTLGGFEIEEILEVKVNNKKIITLDITATANRSDSLSVQGLTLEIAALLNKSPKLYKYINKPFNWYRKINNVSKITFNSRYCSIFIAIVLESLTNVIVPRWLKQKLSVSGIVPHDNLLDFRDFILLETGYPFEFYDFENLTLELDTSQFEFYLRYGKREEQFHLSKNVSYSLDNSVLVINANNLPISIAGVASESKFNYSNSTNSLLIEGSIFNAAQVRQQSRFLGLRTDRSSRYEKSLKNITLIESLYKLILLLRISNPNLVCKLHTFSQLPKKLTNNIELRNSTLKEVLGPISNWEYISPIIITEFLVRLNFSFNFDILECKWHVKIPYLRSEDITSEIDLIEEIGRLFGFNKFLTRLPNIKFIGLEDSHYKTRKKIISSLLSLGLSESINYSFFNQITNSRSKTMMTQIKLINPLITDYSYLRISLLPNLLKIAQENLKQGNSIVENFECGHIFSFENSKDYYEEEYIAGIFCGTSKEIKLTKYISNSVEWLKSKGKMEHFFNQLNCILYWKLDKSSQSNEKLSNTDNIYNILFHPYRKSNIFLINNSKVGIFGQIHPIIVNKLNLLNDLYLFEFNFKLINAQLQSNKTTIYNEYSIYPKVSKDLSFFINKNVEFDTIKNILYLNGTKFLVNVIFLDQYMTEKNINSLCLQLSFQSKDKTLMNQEVESIMKNLKLVLLNKFNVIFRD